MMSSQLHLWRDILFTYIDPDDLNTTGIQEHSRQFWLGLAALLQNGEEETWRKLHLSRKGNGEGNGTPLQYSCLENPMGGGAWWAAVHGVTKSLTQPSDLTFTFHFHALEKEMATHSSVRAWRIPGTGEPDGLPSVVSHRVANDWSDLAAAAAEKARASLPSPLWCLSIPKSWAFKLTM